MSQNLFLTLLFLTVISIFTPLPGFSEESSETSKSFNPKPASASVYNLGLKSYEQGDLQSATSFFKRAVDLDPDFVDAYYNLGAIYKKQGDISLAINAFQKAVDITPGDAEATFELASCYLLEKNYLKAKKYFSSVPQDFPRYSEAKKNLVTINQYLALEIPAQAQESQAQLVSEKLGDSSQPQAQLLVDTLTKPGKEVFKDNFRIIRSNFNGPTGVVKDSRNNIYIANFTGDKIERINNDGKREVFVEKLGIKGPVGLAIDENDNLYVANYGGDSITKITPDKEASILVSKIIRPYYLFYDTLSKKLLVTVQGNDALVEVDTLNVSKQPITSR